MRIFIITILLGIAVAAPQYSYEQQQQQQTETQNSEGIAIEELPAPVSTNQPSSKIIYNKQFFIHSAPDDSYDTSASNQLDNILLKKNLRVVFIKSPENKALEKAALHLAKAAGEDQTAIYVLNKQTDLDELQKKLNHIQDLSAAKPEVHFIKYRTPQEAEHAQHSIQATYDQLGGSTQVSHEGVAPVQSFIGTKGAQSADTTPVGITGIYLPPVYRH